jgi:phi13 family phage major tail protein
MATIGLDCLYYAKITEGVDGTETYGAPEILAKAIKADLSVELAEAILYADDSAAEVVKAFKSGKLSLGIDDIGTAAAQTLTGASVDDNGVLVSATENIGAPVAVGFRAQKANGKYRYFWIYRVVFGVPATNLQTKGDSISFQTPTIEGTIMRRNKPDGNGNHPWKSEVTEGETGVAQAAILSWFTAVYEPIIGLKITVQPSNKNVGTADIDDSLSITATTDSGTLTYQWYSNIIKSNAGGVVVTGATTDEMDLPETMDAGTYYYYCVVSNGTHSLRSAVATVVAGG